MKHSFRSLSGVLSALAVWATLSLSLEVRGQGTGDRGQGQQLVAEAAQRLLEERAIAAELRYRVDAFGHVLVGAGTYYQLAAGSEKLLRLDLRMQVGEEQATIQEIRGAEAYWIRRHVPPAPPTLGRVDLKQLRRSLTHVGPSGARDVMPQGAWIMQGGLARLISALEDCFQFAEPRADELQFQSPDGQAVVLPIWIVSGAWKPHRLAALAGKEAKRADQLPEQFPDRVELVLGRTSDILPLFPYRITYWRSGSATTDSAAASPRELLTLELYNVSRRAVDPREFDYQPGDQEVENLTSSYAQRLASGNKLR